MKKVRTYAATVVLGTEALVVTLIAVPMRVLAHIVGGNEGYEKSKKTVNGTLYKVLDCINRFDQKLKNSEYGKKEDA